MTAAGMPAPDQDRVVPGLMAGELPPALSPVDRALLSYAVKLTRTPWEITARDTTELRSAGLDDRGIHDLCAITAYFAFVNRIADGLGVELEERFGS